MSTRDVGVGEYFYGAPKNGLENRLERIDGVHAEVLAKIEAGDKPGLHADVLRKLLWTLAVRTRAMRLQFVAAGTRLLDHLEVSAGSDEASAALQAQASLDFDRLLSDELAKLPTAYGKRYLELLECPIRKHALRSVILGQIGHLDLQAFVGTALRSATSQLDLTKLSTNGQIRSLSKLLEAAEAPPGFVPAHWVVLTRTPGTFVLGDGCVFATDGKGPCTSVFAVAKSWRQIYLPISSGSVLVAASEPIEGTLSDEEINCASVQLASDVFFACQCTANELALVARLGTGVPLVADEQIAVIAREGWQRLREESQGGKPT